MARALTTKGLAAAMDQLTNEVRQHRAEHREDFKELSSDVKVVKADVEYLKTEVATIKAQRDTVKEVKSAASANLHSIWALVIAAVAAGIAFFKGQ